MFTCLDPLWSLPSPHKTQAKDSQSLGKHPRVQANKAHHWPRGLALSMEGSIGVCEPRTSSHQPERNIIAKP